MAESLLASLYSRIKGSQEDVATVSLQYILSSSEKLNTAYNRLLEDALKINIGSDVHYSCQSVGEEKERPDMAGVDSNGNEVILCEMKFYAGLTDNQPNGYLKRLISKKGKALVFVCPETRKISLWRKVVDLCKSQGRTLTDEDEYRITVDGIAMSIIDNVTDEALINYNLDHYWMLTDKGREELQNNPYIELYTGPHKYRLMEIGLGYEKIASELNGLSPNRYRDVVWKNLNEMSVSSYASAMKTTNFFQYREVLRTMGLFLEEEEKYKEGLYQYLRCVYYNVNFKAVTSALVNYKMFKKMKDASDAFMLDAEIMPYEIDDLTRLIDKCGFKSKDFDAFMLDSFQKERDTGIFNPQEMVEFVNHGLRKHTGKQRAMFDTNFKKKMRIR